MEALGESKMPLCGRPVGLPRCPPPLGPGVAGESPPLQLSGVRLFTLWYDIVPRKLLLGIELFIDTESDMNERSRDAIGTELLIEVESEMRERSIDAMSL